jgi:hypothetical protein
LEVSRRLRRDGLLEYVSLVGDVESELSAGSAVGREVIIIAWVLAGLLLRAALALNKRVATTVRKLCSSTLTGQAVRVRPGLRRAGGVQRYCVDVYSGTVGAPGGSFGKCWMLDR